MLVMSLPRGDGAQHTLGGHPLQKPLPLVCPADLTRASDQTDLAGASTFTSCRA